MKKQIFLGHLLTLFLGGLVYILFRYDTLKMFSWFESINLTVPINKIRLFTLPLTEYLPNWFLYSLPDGLWLFSYISLVSLVWDNTISLKNILWFLIVPILAIFSEIGQFIKIIPGTFDVFDLIFYVLGTILPIITYTNFKIIKNEKHY